MTPETPATAFPCPLPAVPWPTSPVRWYAPKESPGEEGLVAVWGVGPIEGPVSHFGSSGDPRNVWRRLVKADPLPLAVHHLVWCQGSRGHTLSRAVRKLRAGTVTPSEHRLMVEVEAARLGIEFADHFAVIAAMNAAAGHRVDELREEYQFSTLTPAEVQAAVESYAVERRDRRAVEAYRNWELNCRRNPGVRPRKLFQRNRRIANAYKDGATLTEIGAQHGLSFGRVRTILDNQGVERRPAGGYIARRNSAA